jgi:hypothetical protein
MSIFIPTPSLTEDNSHLCRSEISAEAGASSLKAHQNSNPLRCSIPFIFSLPVPMAILSQSSSFTLRFEQAKNVVFANWALDVADN